MLSHGQIGPLSCHHGPDSLRLRSLGPTSSLPTDLPLPQALLKELHAEREDSPPEVRNLEESQKASWRKSPWIQGLRDAWEYPAKDGRGSRQRKQLHGKGRGVKTGVTGAGLERGRRSSWGPKSKALPKEAEERPIRCAIVKIHRAATEERPGAAALTPGGFCPQGTCGHVHRCFWLSKLGGGGTTSIHHPS